MVDEETWSQVFGVNIKGVFYYANQDDVIRDALTRLRQTMPENGGKSHRRAKSADQQDKKELLTEAELQQHMLEIGLMSQLPDTDADFDDPNDLPISIEGEPLSETIIRVSDAEMVVYFFDSSALVKRHVDESGSAWVRSLTRVKAGQTPAAVAEGMDVDDPNRHP